MRKSDFKAKGTKAAGAPWAFRALPQDPGAPSRVTPGAQRRPLAGSRAERRLPLIRRVTSEPFADDCSTQRKMNTKE
ncbi:hypothetical protein EK904_003523 [Melospiza melodia maxima]|nr:hypothetical protein EK904_003523 [Melospiza melodia maxima]